MKALFILIFIIMFLPHHMAGEIKTIHVFVALCDNEFQGIVKVPENLGNGKDPSHNLYWGAAYGIKNYFRNKTTDWKLIKISKPSDSRILERLLFKHQTEDVYLLADAYDGEKIKDCTIDFLLASNGQCNFRVSHDSLSLEFGGGANLLSYIGHDGLMDFQLDIDYKEAPDMAREVIILACISKDYFSSHLKQAGAKPLLWTTGLMAPEAYSFKAAIDGWILHEEDEQIEERAAQAYHKYQKCGIRGARNLFTTGY